MNYFKYSETEVSYDTSDTDQRWSSGSERHLGYSSALEFEYSSALELEHNSALELEHSPALELGHSPALELGCKKTPQMQFGVGARTQEDTAARETLQTRGVA